MSSQKSDIWNITKIITLAIFETNSEICVLLEHFSILKTY